MTDVKPILTALETLNHNQLSGVIERAHELIELRQRETRKAELVSQLNSIFNELDALYIHYWFGMPARNGDTELFVMNGVARIEDDGEVIID